VTLEAAPWSDDRCGGRRLIEFDSASPAAPTNAPASPRSPSPDKLKALQQRGKAALSDALNSHGAFRAAHMWIMPRRGSLSDAQGPAAATLGHVLSEGLGAD